MNDREPVASPSATIPPIYRTNMENIQSRLRTGKPVQGFMLDMCLALTPLEVVSSFGPDAASDPLVRDLFANAGAESMEETKWSKLIPNNGLDDPMVVPFITRHAGQQPILANTFDTSDRKEYLGIENSDAAELLIQVISRKLLWIGGMSWARAIAKEALVGEEHKLTTTQIAETFLAISDQADPSNQAEHSSLVAYDSHVHISEEPEVIIHIPVAAAQERDTLPRLLRELAQQNIDPAKVRTILTHNARERAIENSEELEIDINEKAWMQQLYADISHEFPEFRFSAYYVSGRNNFKIGFARRFSHTMAIQDYLDTNATNNPLMLNLDADTTRINRDFLSNLLETANITGKPVISTRLEWDTSELARQAPTAAKLLRFSSFMGKVIESDRATPVFYDCGTAIRMREYCLAGGHVWHDEFYETGVIPHTIKLFNKNEGGLESVVAASKGSRFASDPRRQLYTMFRGYIPESAWDPDITTFGDFSDPVRLNPVNPALVESRCITAQKRWIFEMVELHTGQLFGTDTSSEIYTRKRAVIEQGLKIIGLPTLTEILG